MAAEYFVLIKFVLLYISFFGLILFSIDRFKIKIEFSPILVISCIVSLLHLAGIANILLLVTYLIYLLGFGYILYLIIKRDFLSKAFNIIKNPAIITFVFLSLVVTYFLKDQYITCYDDFAHWALVIKGMLITDKVPNAHTSAINFTSYPLGSTLFLYYGCRLTTSSESMMLTMQAYFLIASIIPLYAFAPKRKFPYVVLLVLIIVTLFFAITGIHALRVDTLLACVGFGITAIIMYYRDNLKQACLTTLSIFITVVLIKNSGIFFAIINIILLFYLSSKLKNADDKKITIRYILGISTILLLVLFFWQRHVDLMFANVGKHSMNLKYFIKQIGDKNFTNIIDIMVLMLKKTFSIKTTTSLQLIILFIIQLIIAFFVKKNNRKTLIKTMFFSIIVLLLYIIGVFAMYVFSMPLLEAVKLAAYERYLGTLIVYLLLINASVIFFISDRLYYDGLHTRAKICFIVLCINILSLAPSFIYNSEYFNIKNDNFLIWSRQYINEYNKHVDAKSYETLDYTYLVYCTHENISETAHTGYYGYVTKYNFLTTTEMIDLFLLDDINKHNTSELFEYMNDYDYLVIIENDDYIDEFTEKYIGLNGSNNHGIFAIQNIIDKTK